VFACCHALQDKRAQLLSALSFSSFTRRPSFSRPPSVVAKAVIFAADDKWAEDFYGLQAGSEALHSDTASQSSGAVLLLSDSSTAASASGSQGVRSCVAALHKHRSLLLAMLMCQLGMILFNLGLTYGFSALGDMTGVTLPASFLAVAGDPSSPYYSYAGELRRLPSLPHWQSTVCALPVPLAVFPSMSVLGTACICQLLLTTPHSLQCVYTGPTAMSMMATMLHLWSAASCRHLTWTTVDNPLSSCLTPEAKCLGMVSSRPLALQAPTDVTLNLRCPVSCCCLPRTQAV
jgi:hypothetical protein